MPYRRTLRKARVPRRKIVGRRKRVAPKRRMSRRVVVQQPQLIKPITLNPGREKPIYRAFTVRNTYLGNAAQIDHSTAPTTTTVPTLAGISNWFQVVRLAYMPASDLTALASLYTHYKIMSVMVTFTLNTEAFTGVISGMQFIPRLLCRYQYDADASTPSDAYFAQMRNVKVYNFAGDAPSARYKWYPRVLDTIYQSSVAGVPTNSSNAAVRPKWFDMEYPAMNHYGIAWMMPYCPLGATLNVEYTINYGLRNQF